MDIRNPQAYFRTIKYPMNVLNVVKRWSFT